jgi:hypothetical protein
MEKRSNQAQTRRDNNPQVCQKLLQFSISGKDSTVAWRVSDNRQVRNNGAGMPNSPPDYRCRIGSQPICRIVADGFAPAICPATNRARLHFCKFRHATA